MKKQALSILAISAMSLLAIGSVDSSSTSDTSPSIPKTPEEARRLKVEEQFSVWDGSHPGLTKAIKNSMNDPKSYEHVETRFKDQGDFILVVTSFRGKNAFGGLVKNTVIAKVDFNGNVIEIVKE